MSFKFYFTFLILIASALGFFQNCASETPFATTDVNTRLLSSPFPYEVLLDQVAYMSCSEQEGVFNPSPSTFFTFRAGAYRLGGLRLTQQFQEDSDRMQELNKVSLLSQHSSSSGTQIQLGLRSSSNYNSLYVHSSNASEPEVGLDISEIFVPLGDATFSGRLVQFEKGAYMRNYVSAEQESESRFEGDLFFADSEIMANEIRQNLSQDFILALSFAQVSDAQPRGPDFGTENPSDQKRNIYGAGIELSFKQPSPSSFVIDGAGDAPSVDLPPRILSSADQVQVNRETTLQKNFWECPEELVFRIVLPQHAVAQGCDMQPDPVDRPVELQLMRNSLFAEDWFIDTVNGCVVPKPERVGTGSCYGVNSETNETHDIEYDFSKPCGIGKGNGVCPHFVSVCVLSQVGTDNGPGGGE